MKVIAFSITSVIQFADSMDFSGKKLTIYTSRLTESFLDIKPNTPVSYGKI